MVTLWHNGGPLDGHRTEDASGHAPLALYYTPAPEGVPSSLTANGYMLVGFGRPPESPWPDQIVYRLIATTAIAAYYEVSA